jgi:hypothetical protein
MFNKFKEVVNTQEKLVSALETISTVTINNKDDFLNGQEFTRTLKISIGGRDYDVIWYNNVSTIQSEWCEIPFDAICLDKPTWPLTASRGKTLKLQLLNNGETVAVI